jgi:hypothetical protein
MGSLLNSYINICYAVHVNRKSHQIDLIRA